MVARVNTVAFLGMDVITVDVQVQMASGLPAFTVVGLPDKAVTESRERVRAAIGALGLSLPPSRITVNLSPADLPKEGSHFDLPIALGLLVAMEVLPAEELAQMTAMGELALDGRLSPVAGVLPSAVHALARDDGFICPAAQGGEAAWADGLEVLAPETLLALINHFKGTLPTIARQPSRARPTVEAVRRPIGVMPARQAASTPGGESSITAHRPGSTASSSAQRRKMSGAGLPWATWSPPTITGKRSRTPRPRRIQSTQACELDEPTASGTLAASRRSIRSSAPGGGSSGPMNSRSASVRVSAA